MMMEHYSWYLMSHSTVIESNNYCSYGCSLQFKPEKVGSVY